MGVDYYPIDSIPEELLLCCQTHDYLKNPKHGSKLLFIEEKSII